MSSTTTMDTTQEKAARLVVAALAAPDASRTRRPSEPVSEMMSRRILGADGKIDQGIGLRVAYHGLWAISRSLGMDIDATPEHMATTVTGAIRAVLDTQAGAENSPDDETRAIINGLRSAPSWCPTSTEIRAMNNGIPSVAPTRLVRNIAVTPSADLTPVTALDPATTPDGPTAPGGIKATDASAAETALPTSSTIVSIGPPPETFSADAINYNRLAGTDSMIMLASGGRFKTMREVFGRLESTAEAARTLYDRCATQAENGFSPTAGQGSTEARASVAQWTQSQRRVGDLFTASMIVKGPRSTINVEKFLNQEIPYWTPDAPVTGLVKADHKYVFDADSLATILIGIRLGCNTMVTGPTGCGKSTLAEQVAARLGRPHTRISIDGEMRRRDILGGWLQVQGDTGSYTAWMDGALTIAYGMPSMIVLDEFDRADPDLIYAAHEALERRSIRIVEQPGRLVHMHPGCAIMANANTRGGGDPTGMYALKTQTSEASRNRFTYYISADYLSAKAESGLLLATHPKLEKGVCDQICEMAADLRSSLRSEIIRTACSTRQVLDIGGDILARQSFDDAQPAQRIRKAFDRIMTERATDPADEAAISGLLATRLG